MPPPLGPSIGPERFALWELFVIVPPLWDVVSAGAEVGWLPWFCLDPNAGVLAADNGWLSSFSVQASLILFKRATCILSSR